MDRFWSRASMVSGLLNVSMMMSLGGMAHAQGVQLRKPDLSTDAGVASFRSSVDQAADRLCRSQDYVGSRIKHMDACKKEVWEEVMEQLSAEQKLALNASPTSVASVGASAEMTATAR